MTTKRSENRFQPVSVVQETLRGLCSTLDCNSLEYV